MLHAQRCLHSGRFSPGAFTPGCRRSSPQVITPRTDCYDHKQVWQECPDAGIANVYHFYHLANGEQVGRARSNGRGALLWHHDAPD